jgi:hypothetical protein
MQAREQNISPIKQRILYFAGTLGISKRDFYAKIGVSRGTLESKTGITEDVITKFFATYPEVSIEWLMLGVGEMLKTKRTSKIKTDCEEVITKDKGSESAGHTQTSNPMIDRLFDLLSAKDKEIGNLREDNGRLKARIEELERVPRGHPSPITEAEVAYSPPVLQDR